MASNQSPLAVRTLRVDVVSDTICPFCFIGKRKLEKAIATLDPAKVKVEVAYSSSSATAAAVVTTVLLPSPLPNCLLSVASVHHSRMRR